MKVLYIEDNPVDLDLTLRALKKSSPQIEIVPMAYQREALKFMKSPEFRDFNLVLTDMHLQDGDGIAVLSHIRGNSLPVAVVILTGQGDEESAVAALKAGADDYVAKKQGYLAHLPKILESALESYLGTTEKSVNTIKVLYLESDTADVDLTKRHFKKHAHHIHLDSLGSVAEFCTMLGDNDNRLGQYDVLLLDYRLPGENGLELLHKLRLSQYTALPVVLITGKGDEEIAVRALKLGANDYVTKHQGYLFKLPSMIESAYASKQFLREHQALKESERRYRSLFEDNLVAMLLIDPVTEEIIDVNSAAVDFYGWSKEEFRHKTIGDINILPRVEIRKELQAMEIRKKSRFQSKHRLADGSIRDVESFRSPIVVDGRKLLYSMVYDVTDKVRAQQEKEELHRQLIQAQKMEAVGQLAGGIAHDFNNILMVILGYSELAKSEVEKGTSLEESIAEINTAGIRAKELVNQILTFARQGDGKLGPIQVDLVVKEVLKFLRSSIPSTISIRQTLDSKALIMGNSTEVHQILMNLCTNAAYAMKKGGVLDVCLREIDLSGYSHPASGQLQPGKYLELTVADTGEGIPAEVIDSIFEPYFTTKERGEGTGLGLAVVNGIVASYGGTISVASEVGKGTVFTIILPRTSEAEIVASSITGKLPSGGEEILLVDDEVTIIKLLRRMLETLGYTITAATGSQQALAFFRAEPKRWDLVITDMTMPGMTGDILAKELLKIRSELPIILCTGYSKFISAEHARTIGIRAFINKPVSHWDLAKTVRRVLDEKK
ncbi:response regulator [Desulfosediminicola flagellatus]|uniref:response regulator n=1 Tax=Desulfosediminicola flagellatus TaxID=2569541 RepID=UPI0010ABBBDC|nr:response regulator [Desulfosediminicola flagellatus]